MATGSYLSITTLNVNGFNAQPKDTEWLNGYKNKTPIDSVNKRPTLKQEHLQTESEGLEKRYFMQIETKRKQE